MTQNIEKIIKEEVDKYENDIYAYLLCKDKIPTDYRKLAAIEDDPDDFVQALISYNLNAEALVEKHIQVTKSNQKISTIFFNHIETVKREPKERGIIISNFADNYTLVVCYNEKISSGILMGMISTIEKKLRRR